MDASGRATSKTDTVQREGLFSRKDEMDWYLSLPRSIEIASQSINQSILQGKATYVLVVVFNFNRTDSSFLHPFGAIHLPQPLCFAPPRGMLDCKSALSVRLTRPSVY